MMKSIDMQTKRVYYCKCQEGREKGTQDATSQLRRFFSRAWSPRDARNKCEPNPEGVKIKGLRVVKP